MDRVGNDDRTQTSLFRLLETQQSNNVDRIAMILQMTIGQLATPALIVECIAEVDNVT